MSFNNSGVFLKLVLIIIFSINDHKQDSANEKAVIVVVKAFRKIVCFFNLTRIFCWQIRKQLEAADGDSTAVSKHKTNSVISPKFVRKVQKIIDNKKVLLKKSSIQGTLSGELYMRTSIATIFDVMWSKHIC